MKRMNSKYSGTCGDCRERFPKGTLIDYDKNAPRGLKAFHADCNDPDAGSKALTPASRANPVMEITTASGTFYQRRGGRCEDAPCCGCCTF
jgi:hypothetical protein